MTVSEYTAVQDCSHCAGRSHCKEIITIIISLQQRDVCIKNHC